MLDPFLKELVDSEKEFVSETAEGIAPSATPATVEVTLSPTGPATPSLPRSPNINKSVLPTTLPPASDDDDEDEDKATEFYLPGLTLLTMFLPIPNVRYPVLYKKRWLSKILIPCMCTLDRPAKHTLD